MALQLLEGKAGGIVGRAVSLLARAQPQIVQREALGKRYQLIQAPARGGAPDWDAIAQLAGTRELLLPDRAQPPPGSSLQPLRCPRFERRVLVHTACEVVRRTRMPMYRRAAGLLDPDGQYAGMLFALLHHYTSVRIFTAAGERYAKATADITERLGAPVVYGDDPALLEGCVLTLAPGPAPALAGLSLTGPVLAGQGFHAAVCARVYSGLQASVPPPIVRLCPTGISPHRFAAALYEHCGADVGESVAHQMLCDGQPSDLPGCVRAVMQPLGRLF